MGSYVLQETAYRAAVRPDGRLLVFTFRHGHEKNVYPHTDRWSLACVGDVQATLNHVGLTCASLEDGLTHLPDDRTPAEWAQSQLDLLAQPIELINLPDNVTIEAPDFKFWMASRQAFQDENHARQAFAELLGRCGKQVGDRVCPLDEADLLMELDGFSTRCHNAWPAHPGQRLTGHQLTAMDDARPVHSRDIDVRAPRAFIIDGMPGVALWSNTDGGWTMGGKLELLQHYWQTVFPVHAHPHSRQDWRISHARLVEQLTSQNALPPESITLGKPSESAPHGDIAQWIKLFGEEAQTGSLATVAQHLSGHILGELLLRSCTVHEVRPPADISAEVNVEDATDDSDEVSSPQQA